MRFAQNKTDRLLMSFEIFQVTLEILLSDSFEGVMEAFIADLEGKLRPLELVTSDFLRYSVEEVIKNSSE